MDESETKTETESILDGMCSIKISLDSKTVVNFLKKSFSVFIFTFSRFITVKSFFPEIQVTIFLFFTSHFDKINVPASFGAFVFLMFIGMFLSLSGNIASS